jgi:hypothetical protein
MDLEKGRVFFTPNFTAKKFARSVAFLYLNKIEGDQNFLSAVSVTIMFSGIFENSNKIIDFCKIGYRKDYICALFIYLFLA